LLRKNGRKEIRKVVHKWEQEKRRNSQSINGAMNSWKRGQKRDKIMEIIYVQ
jgi:hypothetical protein